MRKHSQRLKRRQPAAGSRKFNGIPSPTAAQAVLGFDAAFLKLFAETGLPVLPERRGCRAREPLGNLLSALRFPLLHTPQLLAASVRDRPFELE